MKGKHYFIMFLMSAVGAAVAVSYCNSKHPSKTA